MTRDKVTREKLELRADAFREAEASLRLEGLDPTTDSRYLAVKAQLLAGTIGFEEARAAIKAHYAVGLSEKAFATSA